MNEKEIAEIRRRFRANRSNINHIRGCCVSSEGDILSEFDQSLAFLTEDENEKILTVIKKSLSGYIGKNLFDIEFSTQQVLEAEEHKRLMTIRNSSLADDDAVHKLYEQIIKSVKIEGNYIILLATDTYDVPAYSVDGERSDESNEMFTYFLCCICPLKSSKSLLGFYSSGNPFRSISSDTVVSAPEIAFMFPAFDDRKTNIYKTLFYTKSTETDHSEFIDNIFKSEVSVIPADIQRETLGAILEETSSDECTLHMVKALHAQVSEMIEIHKEAKEEEPLLLDKSKISEILEASGVGNDSVNSFEDKFKDAFGEKAEIAPRNLIETKRFELKTPDVVIKVNPKRTDLVKTRVIDGEKYILISAEEGVEVNGVDINIL